MADYYPLLARALDAMPDRSPALRQAVYERARGALIGQLRSLDPPLSEDDIDLERNALEAAILRLERDHGGIAPLPPEPEAVPPIPEPPAPEPFRPPPPANDPTDLPEATLPPASPPDFGGPAAAPPEPVPAPPVPEPPRPAPPLPEPPLPEPPLPAPPLPAPPLAVAPPGTRETAPSDSPGAAGPASDTIPPPVRIQARKAKSPPFLAADGPAEADASAPMSEDAETESLAADGGGQRQRPRIAVVGPRDGRSRLLRNVLVGGILIAVIGLIAVAAFLLRDKPADLHPIATEQQDAAPDGADSKFADRVGGDAAPAERAAPARRPASTAPAPTAVPAVPAQSQPDLAVTQRAVLYEENTGGGANATPTTTQGRVVWRLDTVPGEQGQQLETVVRANAEFPDAGLTLAMTLRRNLDPTLPASHTIELAFMPSGPAAARRNVQDIGLLQGKDEESARGSPVAGLPVRVRENLFLIGLSSLPNDIERNTDILLHKNWFDITLKFTAGPRGIVAFEKGPAGAKVVQSAFDQWR